MLSVVRQTHGDNAEDEHIREHREQEKPQCAPGTSTAHRDCPCVGYSSIIPSFMLEIPPSYRVSFPTTTTHMVSLPPSACRRGGGGEKPQNQRENTQLSHSWKESLPLLQGFSLPFPWDGLAFDYSINFY